MRDDLEWLRPYIDAPLEPVGELEDNARARRARARRVASAWVLVVCALGAITIAALSRAL